MMSGCGWTRYHSERPTIAAMMIVTMIAGARATFGGPGLGCGGA
jgi:hypothetical protein